MRPGDGWHPIFKDWRISASMDRASENGVEDSLCGPAKLQKLLYTKKLAYAVRAALPCSFL